MTEAVSKIIKSDGGSHSRRHGASGTDALGADTALDPGSVSGRNANGLQVGHPASLVLVVGVADVVPDSGSLATDIAFDRHEGSRC